MSRSNQSLTLILGGARSGKSTRALSLVPSDAERVVFVATAEGLDEEMQARISAHRAERPAGWATIEEPLALASAIPTEGYDFVIIDCLTLWVSNLLFAERDPAAAVDALLTTYRRSQNHWIVVSNEVGLGIV